MKNNITGEIIISLILIGVLIFFAKPLNLLMPMPLHIVMVPFTIILFIIFTALLWKEKPGDEREQLHKFIASRFAYFAVTSTLIIGIIVESFQSGIDPWLVIAICIALLAKIIGVVYGHIKH